MRSRSPGGHAAIGGAFLALWAGCIPAASVGSPGRELCWAAPQPADCDTFGFTVVGDGDVNGDSYADVLVGSPWTAGLGAPPYDNYGPGQAFLYLGGPAGIDTEPAWESPGAPVGTWLVGQGLAFADVDADGFHDILVSEEFNPDLSTTYFLGSGRIHLYRGGPSGPSRTPDWTRDGISGTYEVRVARAGDVDGDTFEDVLVGTGLHVWVSYGEGRVDLHRGGPNGLAAEPTWSVAPAGAEARDYGYAIAGAGDVNGDSYDDVVLGASCAGGTCLATVPTATGRAYVYLGGPSGPDIEPAWTAEPIGRPGAMFGGAVAGGDLDADGFSDVIVGAPGCTSVDGRVHVFGGGPGGPAAFPGSWIESRRDRRLFGVVLAAAGDVDGDGFGDLLVGAGETDAFDCAASNPDGRVVLYRGTTDGVEEDPWWRIVPSPALAVNLAAAGDVDGDGFDDFLVGNAYGWTGARPNDRTCRGPGEVCLYLGGDTPGPSGCGACAVSGAERPPIPALVLILVPLLVARGLCRRVARRHDVAGPSGAGMWCLAALALLASAAWGCDCAASRCGNRVVDPGEACDVALYPGDCVGAGFAGGALECTETCLLDTSGCFLPVACVDGIDNDADGAADSADPSCQGGADDDEVLRTDTFVPGASGALTVLWVIDDSTSMCEQQGAVRDGLGAFLAAVREAAPAGTFHIGVVAADTSDPATAGRLRNAPRDATPSPTCSSPPPPIDCVTGLPSPLPRWVDETTPEPDRVLRCLATVGNGGSETETALGAARMALSPALLADPMANAGFFLPGSILVLILAGSEDDCSVCTGDVCSPLPGATSSIECALDRVAELTPPSDFVAYLEGLSDGQGGSLGPTSSVMGVIGLDARGDSSGPIAADPAGADTLVPLCVGPGAASAAPAPRIEAVARAFPQHAEISICDGDLSAEFTELGRRTGGLAGQGCLSVPPCGTIAAGDLVVRVLQGGVATTLTPGVDYDVVCAGAPSGTPPCPGSADAACDEGWRILLSTAPAAGTVVEMTYPAAPATC